VGLSSWTTRSVTWRLASRQSPRAMKTTWNMANATHSACGPRTTRWQAARTRTPSCRRHPRVHLAKVRPSRCLVKTVVTLPHKIVHVTLPHKIVQSPESLRIRNLSPAKQILIFNKFSIQQNILRSLYWSLYWIDTHLWMPAGCTQSHPSKLVSEFANDQLWF